MSDIVIMKAVPEDAKELLDIYSVYVENTAISFEYEVPSVDEFRKRIINISEKYPYIKAVSLDGKILGYAYAGVFKARKAYDCCVETTIYVRKECRRSKVGTLLYNALEDILAKMGILNMNACIAYTEKESLHLTNDSKHFHEKMGFTMVGTFHKCGYKFNEWFDMIWMEKHIGEHKADMDPPKMGEWTV